MLAHSLSPRFAHELTYCTFCPKLCRFACPVAEAEHSETVTPTGKAILLHALERGLFELDSETAQPLFRCTGCELHQSVCAHGIRITPLLHRARCLAGEAGLSPAPLRRAALAESAESGALLDALLPEAPPRGESALLPSHHALVRRPALIRHLWEVLARVLPQPPARWSGPSDPGLALWAAGLEAPLRERARLFAQHAAPFRRLWVSDPEEAWLLREVYPRMGVRIDAELRFPFEALDRDLPAAWWGRGQSSGPVCYHDPCHLARHLGVVDAPRRIIARLFGAPPVEARWSGASTWCCGGGQAYPELDPASAAGVAERRAEQLAATWARIVVTACPRCQTQLEGPCAARGIDVLDLVELVDPRWDHASAKESTKARI